MSIIGFTGIIVIGLFLVLAVIAVIVAAVIAASRRAGASQEVQQAQQIYQPVEEAQADALPTEVQNEVPLTLGETIKHHRIRCGMTQEYVAETLNVSRQAVSKWETDSSDPSTSNLLALAKLFGISAAELLDGIE